jgi:hypothetical protein
MTQVMGTHASTEAKAPGGAKETQLEFLSPLRGLTMFGYELPKACAVGYILRAPSGLKSLSLAADAVKVFDFDQEMNS